MRGFLHKSKCISPEEEITSAEVALEVALPRCVLEPDGSFKRCWDNISLVLAVYIALYTPFQIAFLADLQTICNTSDWRMVFLVDLFVTLFFISDIGINFITGDPQSLTYTFAAC
jgi:hypothetical protein